MHMFYYHSLVLLSYDFASKIETYVSEKDFYHKNKQTWESTKTYEWNKNAF